MKIYNSFYEAKNTAIEALLQAKNVDEQVKAELNIMNQGYYQSSEKTDLLGKYDTLNIKTKAQLLSVPIIKAYTDAMSPLYQNYFNLYLDQLVKLVVVNSSNIRSYRCKNVYNNFEDMLEIAKVFYTYSFISFDILDYFKGILIITASYFVPDEKLLTALLLSDVKDELLAKIGKMIYDSEGVKHISYNLIRGMIQSDHPKAIEMVMDLLKSAKLSEGLRQSVVENIDLGTLDVYKYFLTYIRDENLYRFSSVKRSFLTFTGLEYTLGDKAIDKLGAQVAEVLLEDKISVYLTGDNALHLYLGLYALACEDIAKASDYIMANFDTLPEYKKAVCVFFLAQVHYKVDATLITKALREVQDLNATCVIIDQMPKLYFKDNESKKDFILAYVAAIKPIKKTQKYHIFTNDTSKAFEHYSLTQNYNLILNLTDEINDCYRETYSIFDKYYYSYSSGYQIDSIKHPIVRETLINGVGSNLEDIRSFSVEKIEELKLDLTEQEYMTLASFFKSKRSDTRKYVSRLLAKANTDIIMDVAENLLVDKNKNKQSGAVSILVDTIERIKTHAKFDAVKEKVKTLNLDASMQESIDALLGNRKKTKPLFFDDKKVMATPKLNIDYAMVEQFLTRDIMFMDDVIEEFYALFIKHKGEEHNVQFYSYGDKYNVIIGESMFSTRQLFNPDSAKPYKDYLFYEDYIRYAKDGEINPKNLCIFKFYYQLIDEYIRAWNASYTVNEKFLDVYMDAGFIPDIRPLSKKYMPEDENLYEDYQHKLKHFGQVLNLLENYYLIEKNTFIYDEMNKINVHYLGVLIEKERDKLNQKYLAPIHYAEYGEDDFDALLAQLKGKPLEARNPHIDFLFDCFGMFIDNAMQKPKNFFDNQYVSDVLLNLIDLYKGRGFPWSYDIYFKLLRLDVMDIDLLYQFIFDTELKEYSKWSKTSRSREILSGISREIGYRNSDALLQVKLDVYKKATAFMLEKELSRTEKDTKYSHVLSACSVFFGTEVFIKTISKMGKMPFVRGYVWGSGGKKESFSNIIAHIRPENDLTQATFDALVKTHKIEDQKLLEACLYNLRFIEYAENYLGIRGLTKAAYYFKAHMNEGHNDAEKKIIRRFTDIDFVDLENGQMDIHWFRESYDELGKKNFAKVYDAAKYMTSGGNHKRAQYFSDAVLGKLKLSDVESRINDKRNQEMILAYGLLPLKGNKDGAALKRYKRLMKFLKESKQFGAQRRQSEALKVSIALNNLARNYGVDATRFSFLMESKLIDSIGQFFTPKDIKMGQDTIALHIDLSSVIKPEIIVTKNGKSLKSIPAKLKKNAYVTEIKRVKKELKDQYKRAVKSFEEAMIHQTQFLVSELTEITKHPVISGVLKDLLFICEGKIGFFDKGVLHALNESYSLTDKMSLCLAHPVHLYQSKWDKWQDYAMAHQIKQPFKQIFRELYTLTEDELGYDGYTNRFAGYQVEARRMLGIMKSRGWMINDYDGFEKIHHQSNLRIDLYAYADWFTAGDIESPSIEKVVFLNNKTGQTMDMQALNPVIFSETMRDLDLVVSVAYVGGVDPVYSHSTMDMRKRILAYNLDLFGVENIEFKDNTVKVKGIFGVYSVHLGSGIIHMENRGMLPVFPIHSQHRGHIFLPFVDEDPKTAEIISKVLMLAEDNKIKDPSVLKHIK